MKTSIVEDKLNLLPCDYSNQNVLGKSRFKRATEVTKKVLYDASHSEYFSSNAGVDADVMSQLLQVLTEEFHWEIEFNSVHLTDDALAEYDILILISPVDKLSSQEIEAIYEFVTFGKSLLFVGDRASSQNTDCRKRANELLEMFGLQIGDPIGYPHKQISDFHTHYICSGLNDLAVRFPACFKEIESVYFPQVIASLPETEKPFLLSVDTHPGRVVVFGDSFLLEDTGVLYADNLSLVKNVLRWLVRQNVFDFGEISVDENILYGKSGKLSIELINSCSKERLDGIRCGLDCSDLMSSGFQVIDAAPIKYGASTHVSWMVKPEKLGMQPLNLEINLPEQLEHPPVSISCVALPLCIPDAEIDLIVHNNGRMPREQVEIGCSFDVEASVLWHAGSKHVPFSVSLDCHDFAIAVEQVSALRWRLKALDIGNCVVKLTVEETGQQVAKLISVCPSPEFEVARIERDLVNALAVEVHHQVANLLPDFNVLEIEKIPFRLMTPEAFISLIYPRDISERVLDILQSVTSQAREFLPSLDELLLYVAPIYSPQHGCCIPYAPELAAQLSKKYSARNESIAYNFLCVEDDKQFGQDWLKGNIASLLLHEKYGHGFFYTQTQLGKQLAILYRYGLLRRIDAEALRSPYLRVLHRKYGRVIKMLNDSSILLNEGFATWVEMTGLENLVGCYSETAHRRKKFLFRDTEIRDLTERSEYFREFDPGIGSKYQIGYDYLKEIQMKFACSLGHDIVVQSVIQAANVDFGIIEREGRIHFELDPKDMQDLILDKNKGSESGADERLKRIWKAFCEYEVTPQAHQEISMLGSSALQAKAIVSKIVSERLKWQVKR